MVSKIASFLSANLEFFPLLIVILYIKNKNQEKSRRSTTVIHINSIE